MDKNYSMTEQDIKKVFDKVTQILLKKNQDYGGASFDLGLNGNMVHLWDKVKRYKTLIERKNANNAGPHFESIEDTLKDIIGYAVIGLLMIEHNME